jgi:tetratricopeptide (TPR) repeat protein
LRILSIQLIQGLGDNGMMKKAPGNPAMHKYRAPILMALLIGLTGFYVFQSQRTHFPVRASTRTVLNEPLDGENEIRNISIKHDNATDSYTVKVDYRFRGDYWPGQLRAYALENANATPPKFPGVITIKRGEGAAEIWLRRDRSSTIQHSTRLVRVEMYNMAKKQAVVSKEIEFPIEWRRIPFAESPEDDSVKDIGTLYKEAVAEIDYGTKDSVSNARKKLDLILSKDSQYVAAYPEMARYHMKTNWGPEGLRQAERALESGLAIDPEDANCHVLIGYVYAHQGRYKEAEAAFIKARQKGNDNLWLWANWGELYLMQKQVENSIAMYSKAIEGERPYNTNDRARKSAYRHLIELYRLNDDVNAMDVLHRKRIAEYGNEACYPYYYARFRQLNYDDADFVLDYARKSLDLHCQHEGAVRGVIGLAYYSKWLAATAPEEKQSYLTQARLYFAEGPKLLYWLAQSEKTVAVIKRLVADGLSIDVPDNDGITALAFAVKDDDLDAVKRLIAMGGNPNAVIGKEKIPILAVAVLGERVQTVRYLIENGADASASVYGGVSLLDLAESVGNEAVTEVLRNASELRT